MENEIKKSYNPFKMYGSWIGFVLGIIGSLSSNFFLNSLGKFGDSSTNYGDILVMYNPVFWIFYPVLSEINFLLVTIVTTPIIFFIYGWVVNLIFRKLNKLGWVIFAGAVSIYIAASFIFSYLNSLHNQSKEFNYIDKYIYSTMMNIVIKQVKSETNNLTIINEMIPIASNKSILISTRFEALDLLISRVNVMSPEEKNYLTNILDMFNDYINKQNQLLNLTIESDLIVKENNEKIVSKIIILKNLLNKIETSR